MYIPEDINLVITNKFGDVYIDDLSGNVDISLSNGVLKANNFTGTSSLELIFARGTVRNMNTGSINLSYAELDLRTIEQLDLVSKSSELDIEKAGVVKMDSRRDKFYFGEAEYLYGNSSFSEVNIEEFIREANCEMKYGAFRIEKVLPDFSRINLESDYTDITLAFQEGASYSLGIEYHEKAIVRVPSEIQNMETLKIGEEFMSTRGSVGTETRERELSIRADHKCYITITTN